MRAANHKPMVSYPTDYWTEEKGQLTFNQETKDKFKEFTRSEFRKHIDLNKKDFSTIEFLLRKGNRQLEIYEDPGIKNILTFR
jgi:Complex 1 protein (LYR family)